jgi:mannosyltransferase OCH1-like enzyme
MGRSTGGKGHFMAVMDAIRYRAVKVFANTSKVLLSLHLRAFPKLRLELPAHRPARRPAPPGAIPRIVWQTNYTRKVTLQVFACFRFNRWLAPTCEYRFHGDEDCDRFVEENYPGEVARAYGRLRIGAARADFWRLLVLLKHGGIYLDIDSNFTGNPERFLRGDPEGVFIAMKNGEVTNYFLAAAPGNPVLQAACDRIVRNITAAELTSVYDLTGPTVLDAVVKEAGIAPISYKLACTQGQFTNKRGQYLDKPNGAWSVAQQATPIVAKDGGDETGRA